MSTVIFEAGSRVGKATVTVTNTVSGRLERHSNVHRVSVAGQTLVVFIGDDDGTYWTSTYPEASVCIDISSIEI